MLFLMKTLNVVSFLSVIKQNYKKCNLKEKKMLLIKLTGLL